jgi:MFS family permease
MVGGIGLAVSRGFVPLFAFYLLFVVGEAATYLLCFVYATEAFDQRRIGASMGVFDSAMDLSLFLAPLLGAAVYGATGHMSPVFLIAVIPAAATLCVAGSRLDAGRAEQAGSDPPSG